VALRRGSLIVNSSQGGGSKDTWVVSDYESTVSKQTMNGDTMSMQQSMGNMKQEMKGFE
jgi:uncharacterized circularly permuted ATP-grasp superfamily protein